MRIACVQANVFFNDPAANAARAIQFLRELKADGVDLVVFPEAFLTGYCVDNAKDACSLAIPRDHSSLVDLRSACEEIDILCVAGFGEACGSLVYNTAALF